MEGQSVHAAVISMACVWIQIWLKILAHVWNNSGFKRVRIENISVIILQSSELDVE